MTVSSVTLSFARLSPAVRRAIGDGLAVAGLAFAAFLFLVVAIFTVVYITAGRVRFGTGER